MRRMAIICVLAIVAAGLIYGQAEAVRRVTATGVADSARPDSKQVQAPPEKAAPMPRPERRAEAAREIPSIPKDDFSDADGDGINDNLRRQRPPEVRRESEMPKPIVEPEPLLPPAPQQPAARDKSSESPKGESTDRAKEGRRKR